MVSLFVLVCMLCIFLSSSLHFFYPCKINCSFECTPICFFQFFFFLFDIIQCSYLSDIHCCVSVAVFVNSLLCAVNNNTSIQFTTDSTTIHSTQTSDYSPELTILDFIIDLINFFVRHTFFCLQFLQIMCMSRCVITVLLYY